MFSLTKRYLILFVFNKFLMSFQLNFFLEMWHDQNIRLGTPCFLPP